MGWGEATYEIRYKVDKEFRSSFVRAKDPKQAARRARVNGRILTINKVSVEDMFGIGDKYLKKMLLPNPEMFRLEQLFGGAKMEAKNVVKKNQK